MIGPNGSGKTTLLASLAGLLPVAGGSIRLDGADLSTLEPERRARAIGYLEQNPSAHWPIAVEQAVMLGRIPHRARFETETVCDRAAVTAALDRCDIRALAGRPVTRLSGGERARVMLARALAGEPTVLLADEPVAELDPFHQLQVMELMRNLARDGMAVTVVLHDLSLAMRFCDRLYLLDAGRAAASGAPADVIGSAVAERVFSVTLKRGDGWAIPWKRRGAS